MVIAASGGGRSTEPVATQLQTGEFSSAWNLGADGGWRVPSAVVKEKGAGIPTADRHIIGMLFTCPPLAEGPSVRLVHKQRCYCSISNGTSPSLFATGVCPAGPKHCEQTRLRALARCRVCTRRKGQTWPTVVRSACGCDAHRRRPWSLTL